MNIKINKENSNEQESKIDLKNVQNGNNNNLSIGEINNHQECNIINNSNNNFSIDEETRNFLNQIRDSKSIFIEDNCVKNEIRDCLISNISRDKAYCLLDELISKKYLRGTPCVLDEQIIYTITPGINFYKL